MPLPIPNGAQRCVTGTGMRCWGRFFLSTRGSETSFRPLSHPLNGHGTWESTTGSENRLQQNGLLLTMTVADGSTDKSTPPRLTLNIKPNCSLKPKHAPGNPASCRLLIHPC